MGLIMTAQDLKTPPYSTTGIRETAGADKRWHLAKKARGWRKVIK
jgi:hypothetical protein